MKEVKNNHKKLDNPPIKEAVIGVGVSCFLNNKEIENFYESTHLLKNYPSKKSTKNFLLSFDKNGRQIGPQKEGYLLQKDKEDVFIDKNRITLIDKNEYQTFDILVKKYQKIWKAFESFVEKGGKRYEVNDIALRYRNEFELQNQDDLIKQFLILPNISHQDSKGENFGVISEYVGTYFLQSERYKSSANIQVFIHSTNEDALKIIFDIAVHDYDNLPQNFDGIKNTLSRLKKFKNSIFFANIPYAEDLFAERNRKT